MVWSGCAASHYTSVQKIHFLMKSCNCITVSMSTEVQRCGWKNKALVKTLLNKLLVRLRADHHVTPWWQLGRVTRKRVFGHMRTTKAMINLRIRADWSRLLLPVNRIIGHNRIYQWKANARRDFGKARDESEFVHFKHFVRSHLFAWCCLIIAANTAVCRSVSLWPI